MEFCKGFLMNDMLIALKSGELFDKYNLSSTERLVMYTLIGLYDNIKCCFIAKQEHISFKANISRSTVHRTLELLISSNVLISLGSSKYSFSESFERDLKRQLRSERAKKGVY